MATMAGEKRCGVCGKDVSRSKLTKDAVGRYYCPDCTTAPANTSVTAGRTAADARRVCENCHTSFGALERGIEWNGHRVCTRCHETLRSEAQSCADAAAEASNDKATHKAVEVKRERAMGRARWGQIKAVVGAVVSGGIAALLLIAPLLGDRSPDTPITLYGVVIWLGVVGLFALLCVLLVGQFRRISRHIVTGDTDLLYHGVTGGAPATLVTPVAALACLVLVATFMALGTGLGVMVDDRVHDGDGGTRLMTWIGAIVGLGLGVAGAAATWDHLAASFCAKCRRYFVAKTVGGEHVGTETRTYEQIKRLYTTALDGMVLARTDVPVQRQEVTETHRTYCRCRNCGHEWTALRRWTRPW